MFSNKTANNRVLAVAFVSMLVLCSFGVVLTEESDAAYDEQFDIYMRTTDVFSYAPAVNLTDEGTTDIVATGDAYTGGHLGWMNGASEAEDWAEGYTISGSFATSGDYQLVLTATWTDGTLTQSAKQTINFHVYDFIVLSSNSGENSKGYTIDDLDAADIVIDTVQAGSEKYPEALDYSAQIAFQGVDGEGTNSLLTYDTATHQIKTTGAADAEDEGTYTITITASYDYQAENNSDTTGRVQDSEQFVYTVKVGQDLVISSGNELKTYVGNSNTAQNTYTISTNYDDVGSVTLTYDVDAGENQGYINWSGSSSNTFTINTTAAAACIPEGETSGTFTVDVTASGNVDSDEDVESDTVTVTVTVFASLIFTTNPEIDGAVSNSATGNPLDMLATANFEGANRIVYNWGDGTSTTVNVTPDSGSKFSARHVYSTPGTYAVVITAYNDVGNTKAIMLYDATNGAWAEGTEDDVPAEEQSFFEEHGVLFILFAILAFVMFLLYFAFGVEVPYVLIAGIVFVILTVACFLGADFGLTEGLIEDLNI